MDVVVCASVRAILQRSFHDQTADEPSADIDPTLRVWRRKLGQLLLWSITRILFSSSVSTCPRVFWCWDVRVSQIVTDQQIFALRLANPNLKPSINWSTLTSRFIISRHAPTTPVPKNIWEIRSHIRQLARYCRHPRDIVKVVYGPGDDPSTDALRLAEVAKWVERLALPLGNSMIEMNDVFPPDLRDSI